MRAGGFKQGLNSVVVRVGCVWWSGRGGVECVKRRDDIFVRASSDRGIKKNGLTTSN